MNTVKSLFKIKYASIVTLLVLSSYNAANAVSIDIACGGFNAGSINVISDFDGIVGGFDALSGSGSLDAAASACGAHHFNWYQIVTVDSDPLNNRAGELLTVPYVDVPPNGYDAFDDPTWSDNLPWYFDEYEPAAGTPFFDQYFSLSANTTANELWFEDYPDGDFGLELSFKTWLVGLNADSSLHSFYDGFSWDFSIDFDGTYNGVTNIVDLTALPSDAEYANLISGFSSAAPVPLPPALYLFVAGTGLLFKISRSKNNA